MAKIDLEEQPFVYVVDMTVTEVRDMIDLLEDPLDLISELDKAQGDVFSGTTNLSYLVIKISQ
jgi:hypothetical protein